ncbi:MAG: GTPase [Candidatus Bathyarchaeia archaeon]|jgi:GTP-binding protein EngB required for normal cell division
MGDQFLVFTGRPNAGKSSIIRSVTGLKVEIGKDPGTTQRIERYPLGEGLTLIDMPGYGKSLRNSRTREEETKDNILDFLELNAGSIALAVHVVNISTFLETESRLAKKGFIPLDIEMVHFMKRDLGVTVLVALNKIDKGPKDYIGDNIDAIKEGLGPSIPVFPVSARTDEGVGALKDEVRKRLALRGFQKPFELIR